MHGPMAARQRVGAGLKPLGHRANGHARDISRRATPSGMRGRNEPPRSVSGQDRRAIGDLNRDDAVDDVGNGDVGFRSAAGERGRHMNGVSVHL